MADSPCVVAAILGDWSLGRWVGETQLFHWTGCILLGTAEPA